MGKNAQQTQFEVLAILLAFQQSTKMDLSVLVKLFDQTSHALYEQNAVAAKAPKTLLTQQLSEEFLFANTGLEKNLASRVEQSLASSILVLQHVNHERKQLLVHGEKVKLLVSLLGGDALPATLAKQYIAALEDNFKKVNFMNAGFRKSVMEVDMTHGFNFSNMDASGLQKVIEGLDSKVDSMYGKHSQLKQRKAGNGPESDGNQQNGPRYGSSS